MGTAPLRARRLHVALCGAPLLAALFTIPQASLPRAKGERPRKPGPGRELEAAHKLAERYDGGVVAPEPGSGGGTWIAALLLDRRAVRALEPVTAACFPKHAKVKIGDRDFAELCGLLRRLPGPKALVLEDTAVSDRGLAAVGRLSDPRRLELGGTAVGDDGLNL